MKDGIDPKLTRQIRANKVKNGADRPVHAAFTVAEASKGNFLSPEATDKVVKAAISRAAKKTEQKPGKVVVFKNLQSFSIEAPASLVESLAADEAIDTGTLGS